MKNAIITIAFISCCLLYGKAQTISPQVVSTTGWYATGGGYTLSQTAGEMCLVQTLTGGNNILTQGFQQPENIFTGVNDFTAMGSDVKLFPNPATDRFSISYEFPLPGTLTISVFDLAGQKILVRPVEEYIGDAQSADLNVAHLAAGPYFVKTELVTKTGARYAQTDKLLIIR